MAFKNRDLAFSMVELEVKRSDKEEIFYCEHDLVTENMGYLRARFFNLSTIDIWGQIISCCQGRPRAF